MCPLRHRVGHIARVGQDQRGVCHTRQSPRMIVSVCCVMSVPKRPKALKLLDLNARDVPRVRAWPKEFAALDETLLQVTAVSSIFEVDFAFLQIV